MIASHSPDREPDASDSSAQGAPVLRITRDVATADARDPQRPISKPSRIERGRVSSRGSWTRIQPGEPMPGHEDPQGVDVNHDCSPENPSGCDSANGERP